VDVSAAPSELEEQAEAKCLDRPQAGWFGFGAIAYNQRLHEKRRFIMADSVELAGDSFSLICGELLGQRLSYHGDHLALTHFVWKAHGGLRFFDEAVGRVIHVAAVAELDALHTPST
jgi:hypothetical protein